MRRRVSLFWSTVIILIVTYLFLRFGVAYFSQLITGAEHLLPVPGALLAIYLVLIIIGLAVHIGMNDENQTEFTAPIARFLRGPESSEPGDQRLFRTARLAGLVVIPLLVGLVVFTQTMPKVSSPTMIRIQHPGLPKAFEELDNPFSNVDEATRTSYIEEGRALYMINCRPCHGTMADGAGPMARGFRLKPADFTDPGTIATVVESFAFWRVKEGNPGLPAESSPWDSAMPNWEQELSDEDIWKIIMAEYDIAGVEPRQPEGHQ
ncbi:MAG: c-type cytochrome [Dehalococcoidia bacterium]